jgi:hypothetical protein
MFAWLGTAIAGGLYPTAQVIIELGASWPHSNPMELVLFGFIAFFFGFLYAGMVGMFTIAAARLYAACATRGNMPLWLASFAGGWAGFLCALPFRREFSDSPWLDVLLATVMGQAGAACSVHLALRSNLRLLGAKAGPREKLRIGLRQLFGATTFFCVIAAVIGALRPSREVYQLMAAALAWQVAAVLAVRHVMAFRVARRR